MSDMSTVREQGLEVNRDQKESYEKKVEQKRRLNPVIKSSKADLSMLRKP